tara:strand:- start:1733 stop:2860 length:1128 start_codon:yes stop_codon:yes gene_type:complete
MFRLAASKVLLQSALERSQEWHSQRGNEYHQAMFPIDSEKEMTFDAIDLEELKSDKRNGIYFIFDNIRNIGYVGMASSMTFSQRFYNGKKDCKDNCPSNCGCFGHINSTPDTCRSSRVITPDAEYRVYCLAEMDAATAEVMQSEVDWYYILLEAEIEMTNAVWALGRAGYTGRPIVSCHIESATYQHFLTISEAALTLLPNHSGGAGAIGPMVSGLQNQLNGYTHRYATKDELELYQGHREITELIGRFPQVSEWHDNQGNPIEDRVRNMNSKMAWISGPLNESDLEHLKSTARGSYDTSIKSKYKRVYWQRRYKGWKWSAYKREFKADGVKRRERVSDNHPTDRAAAIDRELWVIKNKLTDINISNFDWDLPPD